VSEQGQLRLVRVTLVAAEHTVAGGTATTSWRYFDGVDWKSLKDHPDAAFTRLDCGPGMLWQTQAEVQMTPRTWVVRIDRSPNHKHRPTDPLEYLRRQVRLRRYAVRRTYFQVANDGSLRRMPREDAPLGVDEQV
jgi:hypothetical protein